MKPDLSKEAIEFYTQRTKEYNKYFKDMTTQFKPKLKQLTKKLIINKNSLDSPSQNSQMNPYQQKRVKQVFASLTKSNEIQQKIDNEMNRRACEYSLANVPTLSFNYSETVRKIQRAMIPLIEKLDVQMQQKRDDIIALETLDDEKFNDPKGLQDQKDQLYKMKKKGKRLRDIVAKLILMQQKTEERIYKETLRRLERLDTPEEEEDPSLPFSRRKLMVSKRCLEEETKVESLRLLQQRFDELKIQQYVDEQKEYFTNLEEKINKHNQKLGLHNQRAGKKILSQPELKKLLLRLDSKRQQDQTLSHRVTRIMDYTDPKPKRTFQKKFSIVLQSTFNSNQHSPSHNQNSPSIRTYTQLDSPKRGILKKSPTLPFVGFNNNIKRREQTIKLIS